jgi:hypothetical protein
MFSVPNSGRQALTQVYIIIDFDTGKVIYDQLVKPPSPAKYLTQYVDKFCTSFLL